VQRLRNRLLGNSRGASDGQKTIRRHPAVSMGPALVTSSWSRRQDRCTMRQKVSQIGNPDLMKREVIEGAASV